MSYLDKVLQKKIDGLSNEEIWLQLGQGIFKIILITVISKFIINMVKFPS